MKKWIELAFYIPYPNEAVLGLILLSAFQVIINETKTSWFATTKVGPEFEHKYAIRVFNLIETSQSLLQLNLWEKTIASQCTFNTTT